MNMTEEQKRENVRKILRAANVMIDAAKREAVACGDIEQSIGIADRQAQIESLFAKLGVSLKE